VTEAAIVAFYGEDKPAALRHLVADLQRSLADGLGDAFVPRALSTVHTTVIGLDSAAPDARTAVRTLVEDPGTDLDGLAAELVRARPLTVQYGGFEPGRPGLRSRGEPLHERSLVRSGTDVVLVGWPLDDVGEPCLALHDVRVAAAAHGFGHRYPLSVEEPDPDSHLVIGALTGRADVREVDAVVADVREQMARQEACVEMRAEDLAVVLYTQKDLPRSTTTVVPLADLVASERPGAAPTAP
jgi:hypothetical protein